MDARRSKKRNDQIRRELAAPPPPLPYAARLRAKIPRTFRDQTRLRKLEKHDAPRRRSRVPTAARRRIAKIKLSVDLASNEDSAATLSGLHRRASNLGHWHVFVAQVV